MFLCLYSNTYFVDLSLLVSNFKTLFAWCTEEAAIEKTNHVSEVLTLYNNAHNKFTIPKLEELGYVGFVGFERIVEVSWSDVNLSYTDSARGWNAVCFWL